MKLLLFLLLIATHVQAQFDPLERPWPARMSHRVMDDGSMALVTIDGQIFRASDTGWVKDRRASFRLQHREFLPGLEDQATVTLINDSAALAVYHSKPSILRSVNRGQSWEEVKVLTERSSAQQFLSRWKGVQAFGNRLFLNNGDHQVFVSKDRGINWSVIRIGEPGLDSITCMSWLDQRGLVGCTSNRLHLTRDSGRTWSRIPTPFDQRQTIPAFSTTVSAIHSCGLLGDWLIVYQNGSVFYSPVDRIRWTRFAGVEQFHIEQAAGLLYTFSRDGAITCYNRYLEQRYRHRLNIDEALHAGRFLQMGDSLLFTAYRETGIVSPHGLTLQPFFLGLDYRDLEKRSWMIGTTRWTFKSPYLLRKDSGATGYRQVKRFSAFTWGYPFEDGRIRVISEFVPSYRVYDPLSKELSSDILQFPFEECAGDSVVVLELVRVDNPSKIMVLRWVRSGRYFLPSSEACIDRRFRHLPIHADLGAIPSDSVSSLVRAWNQPLPKSFDAQIQAADREQFQRVAAWWNRQKPEARAQPFPGFHLPWRSAYFSHADSFLVNPPKVDEERLLKPVLFGRTYLLYDGPSWLIRMKSYMGRTVEWHTGPYPNHAITSVGTWTRSERGLGIYQSGHPAIRAFVERYASPNFIFSEQELHVYWLFKATEHRFYRWLEGE